MDELGLTIDNIIKSGGVEMPLSDRHFIKGDRLVLKPENDYSSTWLKDLIGNGLTVTDFPSLKIVNPDVPGGTDRTKWFKYTVRMPGQLKSKCTRGLNYKIGASLAKDGR